MQYVGWPGTLFPRRYHRILTLALVSAPLPALTGCIELGLIGSSPSQSTGTYNIPQGAVLAFDLASCPTGWTPLSQAAGRILVGAGVGNLDEDGNDLSVRLAGDTGGREYTTAIPAYSGLGDQSDIQTSRVLAGGMQGGLSYDVYATGSADTTLGGQKADSKLPPFVARIYCKASADTLSVPAGATLWMDALSCPASWQEDTAAKGRFILGAGSGNLDQDGTALTARATGAKGGHEYTSGIPASTAAANVAFPSAGVVLADPGALTGLYVSATPSTSLGGLLPDSNLPPYWTLETCQPGSSRGATGIVSQAVMAFDLSSCPSGWTESAKLVGRSVLGAGAGNTDADGLSLTTRTFGVTGGREMTTAIQGCTSGTATDAPGPALFLGTSTNGVTLFSASAPDTTVGGTADDSNMPPYLVILFCEKN